MVLESLIEAQVNKLVASRGGLCLKLKLASGRGFPDRTILLPNGIILFFELKQKDGRVSKHQDTWMRRLRRQGFAVYIIRSLADAEKIFDQLDCARDLLEAFNEGG